MKAFLTVVLVWAATFGRAYCADNVVLHTVQPGETLTVIADRCGCTVSALHEANPDLGSTDPQPGTALRLPRSELWIRHTVRRGDTMFAISRRYGAAVDEIRQASLLEGTDLEVGMILCVPRVSQPLTPSATMAPADTGSAAAPAPPSDSLLPRWVEVRLPDGRRAWAPTERMIVASAVPASPERVVATARQFLGTPYRWGGESPNGADCSGFVEEVFRLAGHRLPRTADVQFQVSQPLEATAVQPGDLVFFSTYLPGPSHVGIYVGDGMFIHASSSRGVTESRLDETYYARRYLGARRIADWPVPPPAPVTSESTPAIPDANASSSLTTPSPAGPEQGTNGATEPTVPDP